MVKQPANKRADGIGPARAIPFDLDSIVDRLLAVGQPDSHGDEVDRAVNRRVQMKLVSEIRGMIDSDKVETDKAA